MVINAVTASAMIFTAQFFAGAISFITTLFFHNTTSSLLKSLAIKGMNFSMTHLYKHKNFLTYYL